MRYGVHIELIACMTWFYDVFDIYVGYIHYMTSRVLCTLQTLYHKPHILVSTPPNPPLLFVAYRCMSPVLGSLLIWGPSMFPPSHKSCSTVVLPYWPSPTGGIPRGPSTEFCPFPPTTPRSPPQRLTPPEPQGQIVEWLSVSIWNDNPRIYRKNPSSQNTPPIVCGHLFDLVL